MNKMSINLELELKMIKPFFIKEKKESFCGLFKTLNGRKRFLEKLPYFRFFNDKYILEIPSNAHSPSKIYELLIAKGASNTCYAISRDTTIDGCTVPLLETLNKIAAYNLGTILCCVPEKLLYYQIEPPNGRYIVSR